MSKARLLKSQKGNKSGEKKRNFKTVGETMRGALVGTSTQPGAGLGSPSPHE